MEIRGRAWKYGDNINTDVLFPGKYTYTARGREEIAGHALEDLDPSFAANVRAGDLIVGGRNFGCGSSREQAATCLVYNGVGAVIAESFARIFYRNAINNGLLAIVCPEAARAIRAGETVAVDVDQRAIACEAGRFVFPALSATVQEILQAGGLVEQVKRRLASAASDA
ncbi:MAG: 3-isopropylmalate dehydratase [Caldilineaceae bacterium]|nr:3-isopropylmalate dehydratase [Caldilineaceae bacterium]MCY4118887.1 3-isopropylmalate dehydratase [Caldilineaceae bacterium]MDE0070776.1 3-isopropylmalate dehydratase [Caldilineaceae bacterium]